MTQLEVAQKLLRQGKTTVLTGAGISTGAGIPDFRGPDGLWTKNPKLSRISHIADYLADPKVRELAWQVRISGAAWKATPTATHKALAAAAKQGLVQMILTQNTDGLHQAAGTPKDQLVELHGTQRQWRCQNCGRKGSMDEMADRMAAGEADPHCEKCGGITRPDVVLFGENLSPVALQTSWQACTDCNCLLVLGSSLQVQPAASFVALAVEYGANLVIVNQEPTPYNELADVVISEDIQQVVPKLFATA